MATAARNREQALSKRASYVIQRLGKVYGSPSKSARIDALWQRSLEVDEFDWLLLIISLEIDLKVHVPARLVKPRNLTLAQFASAVAALPQVESDEHTLETLQFLATALLGEGEASPARKASKKRRR